MPKIAEIEYTPNPNAVKFVLKEPVAVGFPRNFADRTLAQTDPLAAALFEVGHVLSVYMQDRFLTVTKDDRVGWAELLPRLAPPIRSAPSALGETPGSPRRDLPAYDPDDPVLQQCWTVLQATILPALAADGGGLELVGRHEKQILIRYQGACESCPAGLTGTLMAIEGVLRKEVDPDIVVITV
jgi:NFU1 iron-sulfur cluster scaffold homolog, mitochondrial